MKNLFTTLGVAFFISANGYAVTHKISTGDSVVNWSGAKVVGGAHNGTVGVKSGELNWEKGKLTSGIITIDMKNMVNLDISSEKYQKKLVGHLQSKDFFEVETYPTATFKTTKVQHVKDDSYMLWGKMTIKKSTKDIKFLAQISQKGDNVAGQGEIVFDRTDFNVRYGSGKFFDNLGDKMIADEIKLNFKVVAKK